jgi:hypothetical protein
VLEAEADATTGWRFHRQISTERSHENEEKTTHPQRLWNNSNGNVHRRPRGLLGEHMAELPATWLI